MRVRRRNYSNTRIGHAHCVDEEKVCVPTEGPRVLPVAHIGFAIRLSICSQDRRETRFRAQM
jgi:hypothetical protein